MGSKSGPHSGLLLKNLSRAQFLATKPWPENGLKIRTAFFEQNTLRTTTNFHSDGLPVQCKTARFKPSA